MYMILAVGSVAGEYKGKSSNFASYSLCDPQ